MYFCPLIIQALLQGRAMTLVAAPSVPSPLFSGPPAPAVPAPEWPPHWLVALLSTLPYVLATISLVITSWSAARTGVCIFCPPFFCYVRCQTWPTVCRLLTHHACLYVFAVICT